MTTALEPCSECKGEGALPYPRNHQMVVCTKCQGSGTQPGPNSCKECYGLGWIELREDVGGTCYNCHGSGIDPAARVESFSTPKTALY